MDIHFTRHAIAKFKILKRHGVTLSKQKILTTIESPETIDSSRSPLLIAQSELDETHILRVVYKRQEGVIIVITFYPGRTSHYGKK